MDYSDSLPPITAEELFRYAKQEIEIATGKKTERSDTGVDGYYKRIMTVKGRVWSTENEWRLMWRNDEVAASVYKCPIGAPSITKIFLGMSIEATDREQIKRAVRSNFPVVDILQARKVHGSLAIRFERAN